MALGARHWDIAWLAIKQGVALMILGIVLGLGGTLVVTRIVWHQLVELSAYDPLAWTVIFTTLAVLGLAASLQPTGLACRTCPIQALRSE